MSAVRKLTAKAAKKLEAKRTTEAALHMASFVPNQATLDDVLLREPDIERRKMLFEFMRPVLRFANPHLPKEIEC